MSEELQAVQYQAQRQPDTHERASDLVQRLESQRLRAAPHQRSSNAWRPSKKEAWVQRLRKTVEKGAPPPLGVLCVYGVVDEPGQQYLNEGLQRIYAMIDAIRHPKKYKFRSGDEVEQMLNQVFLAVQNRMYLSHEEAAKDFKEVNAGVGLHPAEEHKDVLVYSKGWKTVWEAKIIQWNERRPHA